MKNQNPIENIKSAIQKCVDQGFKPNVISITKNTLDFLIKNHSNEIQVLRSKSGSKKQLMKVKYKVCGVFLRVVDA